MTTIHKVLNRKYDQKVWLTEEEWQEEMVERNLTDFKDEYDRYFRRQKKIGDWFIREIDLHPRNGYIHSIPFVMVYYANLRTGVNNVFPTL